MDFTQLVSRIEIPKGFSLLGIQPIISIVMGSDDLNIVSEKIKTLSPEVVQTLLESIKETLKNPNYPLDASVFFANDPFFELEQLSNAFADPTIFLNNYLESLSIFEDTYPFIETAFEPLNSNDVLPLRENPITLSSVEAKDETHTEPTPESISSQAINGAGLLIPTLTLGSMYLFTKYAYNSSKDALR
jgi:hypothetical protein